MKEYHGIPKPILGMAAVLALLAVVAVIELSVGGGDYLGHDHGSHDNGGHHMVTPDHNSEDGHDAVVALDEEEDGT